MEWFYITQGRCPCKSYELRAFLLYFVITVGDAAYLISCKTPEEAFRALLLLGPSVIKYAFSAVILASIIVLAPLAARQLRSFDITCGLQTIMQCCLVLLIIVS